MNYKAEICKIGKMMEEKGYLDYFEGNISILDRENNKLYITPTQTRKLTLTEEEVAVLDFETEEQLEGCKKASSEYRLHKAALLARPDCNAVVHCHSKFLTSYAVQNKDIVIKSNNLMQICGGVIPCIPWGKAGTTHIADGLAEKLQDKPAVLLGNHGVVVVAENLSKASALQESLEKATEIDWLAKANGGKTVDIPVFD
ncbi:MAG: class II aldolase/adducin family protein [Erysipelotrichaceae bacterium]|nr:class II aldolase/adducin family protein [Erysipelotrichaceae bacterium]